MSTDTKLRKAQMSKIIQSSGSFGYWLGNLWKKALTNIAISFARDNLSGLGSNLQYVTYAINKLERKVIGKGAVKAGKGFTLFIWNEDMNDFIKIIKSLEDSGVLIEKTRRWISWSIVSTFSHFIITTSNLFSSKRYKWKRS